MYLKEELILKSKLFFLIKGMIKLRCASIYLIAYVKDMMRYPV